MQYIVANVWILYFHNCILCYYFSLPWPSLTKIPSLVQTRQNNQSIDHKKCNIVLQVPHWLFKEKSTWDSTSPLPLYCFCYCNHSSNWCLFSQSSCPRNFSSQIWILFLLQKRKKVIYAACIQPYNKFFYLESKPNPNWVDHSTTTVRYNYMNTIVELDWGSKEMTISRHC